MKWRHLGSRQYYEGDEISYLPHTWIQDSELLRGYMSEKFALPLIWGSGFGASGPPKRPQCLDQKNTKTWGTNRNALDVKLLSISRKTTKARVANHNGLDVKLLRSSWKTIQARVANHNGSGAKLLRMYLKTEEKKKILFLIILWSIFLVVLRPSQYEVRNRP